MEEDNIYRRMSQHDAARIKRLTHDRGHYIYCRYYVRIKDRSFSCKKRGSVKDCNGCFTCPNCGGLMFTYQLRKDRRTSCMFITHTKSCALCGAYIEEHYIGFSEQQKENKIGECEVDGCTNTVYEGHEFSDGTHIFKICLSHRSRMRTWKQHPAKGDSQIPLIVINGRLFDNPDYVTKQGKRK